jgi:hypothetical protein
MPIVYIKEGKMIKIRQVNTKWRIGIENEELEFEDFEVMKETHDTLLCIKKQFGQIKNRNE